MLPPILLFSAFCFWIDSFYEPIPPTFLLPGPTARVQEEEEAEALVHESPLVPLREEEAEAAEATKDVPRSEAAEAPESAPHSLMVVVLSEVEDLFRPTVRLLEADWDPLLSTRQKEFQLGDLLQQEQEQLQGIDRFQEEPWKSYPPQAT